MLLAVDIGNSSLSIGVFPVDAADQVRPLWTAKLSADPGRTADEYAILIRGLLHMQGRELPPVTAAVIGSVVPQLTHTLQTAVRKLTASESGEVPILLIGGGVRTGISLRVDDPATLGADIVTNASAAVRLCGAPVLFVDFGTATVMGAVNAARELVGVSIAPGLMSALDGLRASTAQIPYLDLQAPDAVLGKNTAASVRSGLVLGTAAMIDGLVDRVREELKLPAHARLPIVATGGLADLVLPACRHEMVREEHLTLLGLYFIWKATAEREQRKHAAL